MENPKTAAPLSLTVPRAALLAVLARMPYGGGIQTGHVDFDGEALLAWLDALAERLGDAGALARSRSEELSELRRQHEAVRAFLGTSS